jgi:hypothetical protein
MNQPSHESGKGKPMQSYTITVIKRDGSRKLLSTDYGVMTFRDREHAERMTHRLAASDDSGDLYEINEPNK